MATDSIEEGIDIPTCNVVVRFDEFYNVKSHVQGSGRCRGLGSGGLVLYFENEPEEYICQEKNVEAIARSSSPVGEALASDIQAIDDEAADPSTGALLTESNSIGLLNNYVT